MGPFSNLFELSPYDHGLRYHPWNWKDTTKTTTNGTSARDQSQIDQNYYIPPRSSPEYVYLEYRLYLLSFIQYLSGDPSLSPHPHLILPSLYISDLYSATSPQVLDNLGITHILSLQTPPPPLPGKGSSMPSPNNLFSSYPLPFSSSRHPFTHLTLPLDLDSIPPTSSSSPCTPTTQPTPHQISTHFLTHLPTAISFLLTSLHASKDHSSRPTRILIHDTLCLTSSPALAIAFLISEHKVSYGTAFGWVHSRLCCRDEGSGSGKERKMNMRISEGLEMALRVWETRVRNEMEEGMEKAFAKSSRSESLAAFMAVDQIQESVKGWR